MKSALILAVAIAATTVATEKKVKINESSITWTGHKVTGQHEGTIKLQAGTLKFDDKNEFTGGTFIMDMSTLAVTDLEGDMKDKLTGHLKSEDFFGVEKHPKATFVISKVEGSAGKYKVSGDLTIKNITNPISFAMNIYEDTATADIKIDRTKYDIKYGSASFFDGLKDKAIYDDFDLSVKLKF